MDKLFLTILNMSLTGAFVIAAICLARLPLKKVPKIISYCLWAVAGFRLVFPFTIESIFSLIPFKAETIPLNIATQTIPQIDSGIPYINYAANRAFTMATENMSVNPLQIWTTAGAFIWMLGAFAMIIYGIASYFILKHKMMKTNCLESNIYEAENIKSPFVLGIFKPKIYLPAGLSKQESDYIVLHELTHIKRHDHIVKFAAYFILCLHWFNPLAWVAFLLMGVDMEMSCDERVLKLMGNHTKKDYSLSLLSLATERRLLGGSPLMFGEGGVKGRVKNILKFSKPSRVIVALAVGLVLVLSVGFALTRATNEPAFDIETVDENLIPPIEEVITTPIPEVLARTTLEDAAERAQYFAEMLNNGVDLTGDEYAIESWNALFNLHSPEFYIDSFFAASETRKDENTPDVYYFEVIVKTRSTSIIDNVELEEENIIGVTVMIDMQENETAYYSNYTRFYPDVIPVAERFLPLIDEGDFETASIDERIGFSNEGQFFECLVRYKNGHKFPLRLIISDGQLLPELWSPEISMNYIDANAAGISFAFDNKTDKEFIYGEAYWLSVLENDVWQPVKPVIDNGAFKDIGYIIEPHLNTDMIIVDWRWLYGILPEGTYRFEKNIAYVHSPGDFDNMILAIEFSTYDSQMPKSYEEIIASLTETEAYALIDIPEGDMPVLLVTNGTYRDNVLNASFYCIVYYDIGGLVVKLGELMAQGTGYPLKYDESGLYVGMHRSISRYVIEQDSKTLKLKEFASFDFDFQTDDNIITYELDGFSEVVPDFTEFDEMYARYGEATLIDFSRR